MRILPQDLKNKLLQNIQADSTNAKPNLRLIATQASMNTLISEDIHKGISPNFGDVAVRQLEGEKSPSLAYAICIDNGIANVYKRDFPTDLEKPWIKQWELGSAKEVAIEYNGIWTLDSKKKWYYLKTEEYPYVFYTDNSNTLWVQYWNYTATKFQLATGVSQISACRAWQSSDDLNLNQGLVIGYLKGGIVYYRAFCTGQDGVSLWETEREVTTLGTGNTSLCVFRTNDFRVGFITENCGEICYTLSKRTYAGQSVRPESVYSEIAGCEIIYTPIQYLSAFVGDESTKIFVPKNDCSIEYYKEKPVLEIIETKRIDPQTFEMTFNFSLVERNPLEKYLSISPQAEISEIVISENKITLTTVDELSKNMTVEITILENSSLRYLCPETSFLLVPTFTARFPPEAIEDDSPSISVNFIVLKLENKQVHYSTNLYVENLSLTSTLNCSVLATQVGGVPI